jgi:hypothetical protein
MEETREQKNGVWQQGFDGDITINKKDFSN